MKLNVCSPDGDTGYFDIVAGVLQGDSLAPYLFIICQDYVLRTSIELMKENVLNLAKKGRRYPSKIITDANSTDDRGKKKFFVKKKKYIKIVFHHKCISLFIVDQIDFKIMEFFFKFLVFSPICI